MCRRGVTSTWRREPANRSPNSVASINRNTVPIGVLYAKKIMAKNFLIWDLSCCDSPTDQLRPICFQFIQAFAFNHEVKSLSQSFMELARHTFRYVSPGHLISFQQ